MVIGETNKLRVKMRHKQNNYIYTILILSMNITRKLNILELKLRNFNLKIYLKREIKYN